MDEFFFRVDRFRIERLPAPELRKDPILDRWVVIATDRLGRPQEVVESVPVGRLAVCPFCAGNEHLTPEPVLALPNRRDWQVRIVPNTFPAVRGEGRFTPQTDGLLTGGLANGLHDVVIECPMHQANLSRLPAEHGVLLFGALAERFRQVRAERPELYPFWFTNHGAASGASLEHAHSQLVGLPTVPEQIRQEIDAGLRYGKANHRCVYCDLIEQERSEKTRIVFESEQIVALAPYASRFPCEVWLLPRRHANHFEQVSESDIIAIGDAYHRVLRMLDMGLDDPPFNTFIHTSPFDAPESPHYHWHVEILPRLTGIAGFECGTSMNINPVPPEQAAAYLRKVDGERR
jgi:UDPglucose--hexose-1-phosphate uridylyltransferase